MTAKWRTILFIVGMFLVVILLMDFSRRLEELDRLTTQLETVQAEATAVMGTQVGLATQVAYVTSEAAVEKWAYEDGKWVRDGETLVEILPAGEPAVTEVPAHSDASEDIPNWKLWWELFFGDQP